MSEPQPPGETSHLLTKCEHRELEDLRVSQRRWLRELPSGLGGPQLRHQESPNSDAPDLDELRLRRRAQAAIGALPEALAEYIEAKRESDELGMAYRFLNAHQAHPLDTWSQYRGGADTPINAGGAVLTGVRTAIGEADARARQAKPEEDEAAAAARSPILWLLAAETASAAPDRELLAQHAKGS